MKLFYFKLSVNIKLCLFMIKQGLISFLCWRTNVCMQEAVVVPPHVAFAVRPSPGYLEYVKVTADDLSVEAISVSDFLRFKELIFDEEWYVQPSRYIYFFLFIA